MAFHIV